MKKALFYKLLIITSLVAFYSNATSQTVRWGEAPRFKEKMHNIFVDTSTNQRYSKAVIDSIYYSRKNALQVLDNIALGDTMLWYIRINPDNGLGETPWEISISIKWVDRKFPFQDMKDINGKVIKKKHLKGKVVIVNCWSLGCVACWYEIPYLNKLKAALGTEKYVFIALTYDPAEEIRKAFEQPVARKILQSDNPKFDFHVIPAQKDFIREVLTVRSYPANFFVDRKGVVRELLFGFPAKASDEAKEEYMKETFLPALKKAESAVPEF
jgi:thiol-disulfide isomerase/thioredoxin